MIGCRKEWIIIDISLKVIQLTENSSQEENAVWTKNHIRRLNIEM